MTQLSDHHALLDAERVAIDAWLDAHMPSETTPPTRLHAAMRYAVCNGGKRLRPLLTRAAYCAAGGTDADAALPVACAIEAIHAYSLAHDDLPCMDNDTVRRGQPTCHVQFDEYTALLAGDALLTEAFAWCAAADHLSAATRIHIIACLATAAGSSGMCGGQQVDMDAAAPTEETVAFIHAHKTGDLITAALACGAHVADAPPAVHTALHTMGTSLGLAYQYIDDLLDVHGTIEMIGKTPGKDAAVGKRTALAVYGEEGVRRRTEECLTACEANMQSLPGDTTLLGALLAVVRERYDTYAHMRNA